MRWDVRIAVSTIVAASLELIGEEAVIAFVFSQSFFFTSLVINLFELTAVIVLASFCVSDESKQDTNGVVGIVYGWTPASDISELFLSPICNTDRTSIGADNNNPFPTGFQSISASAIASVALPAFSTSFYFHFTDNKAVSRRLLLLLMLKMVIMVMMIMLLLVLLLNPSSILGLSEYCCLVAS